MHRIQTILTIKQRTTSQECDWCCCLSWLLQSWRKPRVFQRPTLHSCLGLIPMQKRIFLRAFSLPQALRTQCICQIFKATVTLSLFQAHRCLDNTLCQSMHGGLVEKLKRLTRMGTTCKCLSSRPNLLDGSSPTLSIGSCKLGPCLLRPMSSLPTKTQVMF